MLVRREVNKRFLKARPNRHPKNLVPLKNCKFFSSNSLVSTWRIINGALMGVYYHSRGHHHRSARGTIKILPIWP